jgi:outer membrane protein assembly factor BamB
MAEIIVNYFSKKRRKTMSKQFWYAFSSLVLIVLLVSACQPTMAVTETPTTAPSPTASPTASPVPTTVPTPKPVWSYQTGGAIWGAPVISDGTVYFGSDDGNLYTVDAQNGSLIWKFPTQGIVRSRPAIAGGLVYFASDDGYLDALEAQSGTQAWRTDIGNSLPRDLRENLGTDTAPTGWDYMQSSPVVVEGQVFMGSLDGKLYALATDTGKINWTFKTGNKVRATPTVDNGTLYIGSWDKSVYALDVLTGQMLWNTPVGGEVQTTALVANGLVYTASRKASVVALDAQTGEKRWEFDYGTNLWVESSPVMNEGIVYIGSAGNKWILGLDGQTGEASTAFLSRTYFMSAPAIVADTLFIGGVTFRNESEGGLFVFKLVDGSFADPSQPYWYFPVEESLEAEGNWNGVMSSPVVDDGVVYFGGLDGILYVLSTSP